MLSSRDSPDNMESTPAVEQPQDLACLQPIVLPSGEDDSMSGGAKPALPLKDEKKLLLSLPPGWSNRPRSCINAFSWISYGRLPSESVSQIVLDPVVFECRLSIEGIEGLTATGLGSSTKEAEKFAAIQLCRLVDQQEIADDVFACLSATPEDDTSREWFAHPKYYLHAFCSSRFGHNPAYEVHQAGALFFVSATIDAPSGLVGRAYANKKKEVIRLAVIDACRKVEAYSLRESCNNTKPLEGEKSNDKESTSPHKMIAKQPSFVATPETAAFLAEELPEFTSAQWYNNPQNEVQSIFARHHRSMSFSVSKTTDGDSTVFLSTVSLAVDPPILGCGKAENSKKAVRFAARDFCRNYYRVHIEESSMARKQSVVPKLKTKPAKDAVAAIEGEPLVLTTDCIPPDLIARTVAASAAVTNDGDDRQSAPIQDDSRSSLPRTPLEELPVEFQEAFVYSLVKDKVAIIFSQHGKDPAYSLQQDIANDSCVSTLCFDSSLIGIGKHRDSQHASVLAAIDFLLQYRSLAAPSVKGTATKHSSKSRRLSATSFLDAPASSLPTEASASLSGRSKGEPVEEFVEPLRFTDDKSRFIKSLFKQVGREPMLRITRSGLMHLPDWRASLELVHGPYNICVTSNANTVKMHALQSAVASFYEQAANADQQVHAAFVRATSCKPKTREEVATVHVALTEKHKQEIALLVDRFGNLDAHLEEDTSEFGVNREETANSTPKTLGDNLLAEHLSFVSSADGKLAMQSLERLEVYLSRERIVTACRSSQVVIVAASAGSGKSTLIPSILLDDMIMSGSGSLASILVTEPRRIAAISLARHVARVRGEGEPGRSVGYHVRFDSCLPRPLGSITYCTTGILLTCLRHDPDLRSVSHVIIDEVHERDLLSDFSLLLLRDLLKRRPRLRVILMSATLAVDRFVQYFEGIASAITIPSRPSTVTHLFLEDFLGRCDERLLAADDTRVFLDNENQLISGGSRLLPLRRPREESEDEEEPEGGEATMELSEVEVDEEALAVDTCAHPIAALPYSLLEAVLGCIIQSTPADEAVLVFLPGWDEIRNLAAILQAEDILGIGYADRSRFAFHTLHSQVPLAEQARVFECAPPGARKIILATNIAETSITVEDVVHVVDLGKVKVSSFDGDSCVHNLSAQWCPQSSLLQRAGRAGRVAGRTGTCWCLMSKQRFPLLPSHGVPEILRADLQELCLQIKAFALPGRINDVLLRAIDMPSIASIRRAVEHLQAIDALDSDEGLTGLGRLLIRFPLSPPLGKMLIYGLLFSCLDPMLTIAASISVGGPFVSSRLSTTTATTASNAASRDFRSIFGPTSQQSDHLAVADAYMAWKRNRNRFYNKSDELQFCHNNGMSLPALHRISQVRQQLIDILAELNLFAAFAPVCEDEAASNDSALGPRPSQDFEVVFNRNSSKQYLVRAITLIGLYPQLAIGYSAKNHRQLLTRYDNLALIHPSSINYIASARLTHDQTATIFAFQDKIRTRSLFLLGLTAVSPAELVLFAKDDSNPSLIAGWIRNESPLELNAFRALLSRLLNRLFWTCANNNLLPTRSNANSREEALPSESRFVILKAVKLAIRLATDMLLDGR